MGNLPLRAMSDAGANGEIFWVTGMMMTPGPEFIATSTGPLGASVDGIAAGAVLGRLASSGDVYASIFVLIGGSSATIGFPQASFRMGLPVLRMTKTGVPIGRRELTVYSCPVREMQ